MVVDTETSALHFDDGGRISTVSVAFRCQGELCAYAFPFDQGPVDGKNLGSKRQNSLFDEQEQADNLPEEEWVALMSWLGDQDLVFHNAKFDLHMLRVGTRLWAGADMVDQLVWDTQLAQWTLDPTYSAALEATVVRLFEEDIEAWKAAIKPYLGPKTDPRYDLVPWSVMKEYATKDAEYTLRLYEMQQERVRTGEDHLLSIIHREIDVCRILYNMEKRGIGYDIDRSRKASKKAHTLLNKTVARLPFRPTDTEARKWFYNVQHALPHCTTAGGAPSVSECCVRTLIAQEIPGAAEWAKFQKVKHAISVYYDGYVGYCGEDGRLRTDFRQHGTVNMRFSSQRVNLQALPHDYRLELVEGIEPPRSLFRAEKGKVLYEFDLSQAELRRGARVAGCQRMLDLIQSGEDLHDDTCRNLFKIEPGHPQWFERRQTTKRCNFGLIYQVGPDTFMKDLEKHTGIKISRGESEDIVGKWRDLYPEFPRINRKAETMARRRGYIRLASGRFRWFRPDEELHKAFNAKIQGDIAEFMKIAMIEIDRLYPGTLLLQIHDSIVMEIDQDQANKIPVHVAGLLGGLATDLFQVPMNSDAKVWHAA